LTAAGATLTDGATFAGLALGLADVTAADELDDEASSSVPEVVEQAANASVTAATTSRGLFISLLARWS
jgi:hypothetical protein